MGARRWQRRADGDGIVAAVVGRRRRRRGGRRRSRAPELDPFHPKNEDDEAERTVTLVGPGEAPVDGDVAAGAAKPRAWRRLGVGLLHGGGGGRRGGGAASRGGPL